MREVHRGRSVARFAAAAVMTIASLSVPGPAAAGPPPGLGSIPLCERHGRPRPPDPTAGSGHYAWSARLDPRGWLIGNELRLGDALVTYRAVRSAFAAGPFGGTLVVGERSATATQMHLVDLPRACVFRRLTLDTLVFGVQPDAAGDALYVSSVEPGTHRELGVWRVGLANHGRSQLVVPPPSGGMITAVPREVSLRWDPVAGIVSRWCAGRTCVDRAEKPRSEAQAAQVEPGPDVVLDSSLPLVSPRPVPSVAGWRSQTVLSFRWHATETPPSWMRPALKDAARDATSTSMSASPIFVFDADASDTMRYTADFPGGGCAQAIACASRSVPDWWTVRVRVQGYDFRWGSLRWCQADPGEGCFDVERTVLHELGHAGGGLEHPEDGGFRLRALDTVMHSIIPARTATGSGMHAFGPCDVASLQVRFSIPSLDTPISTCSDIDTRLSLAASTSIVADGDPVVFRANFSTADRAAYGNIAGIPLNLRSIQLRRRPAGMGGAWSTFWMGQAQSPGTYVLTLRPSTAYEYQAVFRAPDDEGLNGSTSNVITVRITGTCNASPCDGGSEV